MLEYGITASVRQGGIAKATANQSEIAFDATAGFLTPKALMLKLLAACVLKNK